MSSSGRPAVEVMLGNVDHQAQVVLDHLLPGEELPRACPPCPTRLLGRRKKRLGADLVEIVLGDVVEQIAVR
jgi:hypothetical protein